MKRTALVGGGGSGIGAAVAAALLADGMTVALTGRRPEVLAATAARLASDLEVDPARLLALPGDLAVPGDIERVVAETSERAGGPDVLVVNAGGPPPGTVLAAGDEVWHDAVELLLLGPRRALRATLPGMAARGFGRVVLITSALVRLPAPDLGLSVVLRSAATSMVKLASLEHAGDGVTLNCVAPGPVATARRDQIVAARAAASGADLDAVDAEDVARVPAGRVGRPEEVAEAVRYLASDAAGFVNGTVLTVDGGMTGTLL